MNNLPHTSGVYQIRCLPTGKIYVGSTVDLRHRWEQHYRELRRGDHHNHHLQNGWDKYGEENFEFVVLELVAEPDLLRVEQAWLDKTGCANPEIGFNIFDTAGSPGEANVQVWEGFVDPEGNEVTITNLFAFCRTHGLDFPSMHRLAMGESKLKSYKGWTHRNSVRQRDYIKTYDGFIDPAGDAIGPITNLAAFCREHGLDNTHMVAVAHGRLYSHQGWTYNNDRQNLRALKVYTSFINPDGQRVVITDLKAFCLTNGLDRVHKYEVMGGKRKSHKGWIWKNENE